jgi:precorrin-6B methylase 1
MFGMNDDDTKTLLNHLWKLNGTQAGTEQQAGRVRDQLSSINCTMARIGWSLNIIAVVAIAAYITSFMR